MFSDCCQWLTKYTFCIVLFTHPPRQYIYEVVANQMQNWTQNRRFCVFDLPFRLNFAPFAPINGHITQICLVLMSLPTYPCNPLMKLQHIKWKIGRQMDDVVFLTPVLTFILANIASINGHNT